MKSRHSKAQTILLIIGAYVTVNFWLYVFTVRSQRCWPRESLKGELVDEYQPRIISQHPRSTTNSLHKNLTIPTPVRLRPLEKTSKFAKSQPPTQAAKALPATQKLVKTLPKEPTPVGTSAKSQDKHQNFFDAWDDPYSFRDALLRGIHGPFHDKTLNTCVNKCHPANDVCNITNQDAWVKINNAGKLPLVNLFPENQRFFPWERDFLPLSPMTDLKTLPDLSNSVIKLLTNGGVQTANSVVCKLDQTLTFRLDLYDGYGRRRTRGNDRVLAWVIGYSRKDQNETYRAASQVNDLKNGSYEIHVRCLWVGSIQLRVGIVYPKEYLRLVFQHFRIGSHRFLTGLFKVGEIEEVTLCFGLPNVPGRPCLCNFTSLNGIPFYCGRPLDNRLTCEDFQATQQLNNIPSKNYTQAEAAMAEKMSRPLSHTLVKHNISITVLPDAKISKDKILPSRKCDRSLLAKTWDDKYPHGFFNKNDSWTSLLCKGPDIDKQKATECLRNKTLLLIGDLNMLYLHQSLKSLIKCYDNKTASQWAVHSVCKTRTTNTMVHFVPHEYPLYQHPKWNPLSFQGGVAKTLDTMIPSEGKHIVLYHFFLHPISSHLSTTFLGLHNAKEAFKRLLHRNPRVLIGVRGPHVTSVQWPKHHLFGGDVQGTFARAIYRHVFRELWDSVVFLDGWEMTTAMENEELQPPQYVADAMINTLLSFYCD